MFDLKIFKDSLKTIKFADQIQNRSPNFSRTVCMMVAPLSRRREGGGGGGGGGEGQRKEKRSVGKWNRRRATDSMKT
eukprot:383344-Hanusia_phi.AAC.2